VIKDLSGFAKRQGAIFIKIDPDIILGKGIPDSSEDQSWYIGQSVLSDLSERGWHFSDEQVQFRNTVLLDLQDSEEDLLARMKQKTRYNLRLAERKGVIVRTGSLKDLPRLYQIYAETSIRDGFVIRSAEYYYTAWKTFMSAGLAEVLIAEIDSEIIAGLILFTFAHKAWYVYGMSREIHREKMPNYLLQWRAIQYAKAKGCTSYDLWGAPDQFIESDPLWRVYRFKEGLGGHVVRHIGAWDHPVQPIIYRLYTRVLPRLLDLMRKKGKADTKRDAGF
jgi:lipid II:glycine glycyltransferase (peptidoglycan interpeptide bridge formation enzyme)